MKKLVLSVLLSLVTSLPLMAFSPLVAEIPSDNIFLPFGYDSNDNVEIVVTGTLPNSCYKAPSVKLEKSDDTISVFLMANNYSLNDGLCREIKIPFTKTISLGVMKEGTYRVIINENTPEEFIGILTVSPSNGDQVDSFIYANVDFIRKNFDKDQVELKGTNPVDCFELDRVEVYDNGVDTYAVLPILKQTKETCLPNTKPFSYVVDLPQTLKNFPILIHVRSMNGRSVNTVITGLNSSF